MCPSQVSVLWFLVYDMARDLLCATNLHCSMRTIWYLRVRRKESSNVLFLVTVALLVWAKDRNLLAFVGIPPFWWSLKSISGFVYLWGETLYVYIYDRKLQTSWAPWFSRNTVCHFILNQFLFSLGGILFRNCLVSWTYMRFVELASEYMRFVELASEIVADCGRIKHACKVL